MNMTLARVLVDRATQRNFEYLHSEAGNRVYSDVPVLLPHQMHAIADAHNDLERSLA